MTMDVTTVNALIAAGAAVAGAVITGIVGPLIKDWLENRKSTKTRSESGVPEIMKTRWSADWLFEDGSVYAKDVVTFDKWTKKSAFEGYGDVTFDSKQYRYSITGEVSPRGVVVLTYKAERFPTEGNIGTACLQLSLGAANLDGNWVGIARRKGSNGPDLQTGAVKMVKIKDLK